MRIVRVNVRFEEVENVTAIVQMVTAR